MIDPWLTHYILDEAGNPKPEPDFRAWGRWYERSMPERKVGDTTYTLSTEEIRISTVFLSMPHVSTRMGADDGPMLYETMVFACDAILVQLVEMAEIETRSIFAQVFEHVDIQKRYKTKDEAIKGHQVMCEFVSACLPRLKMPEQAASEE